MPACPCAPPRPMFAMNCAANNTTTERVSSGCSTTYPSYRRSRPCAARAPLGTHLVLSPARTGRWEPLRETLRCRTADVRAMNCAARRTERVNTSPTMPPSSGNPRKHHAGAARSRSRHARDHPPTLRLRSGVGDHRQAAHLPYLLRDPAKAKVEQQFGVTGGAEREKRRGGRQQRARYEDLPAAYLVDEVTRRQRGEDSAEHGHEYHETGSGGIRAETHRYPRQHRNDETSAQTKEERRKKERDEGIVTPRPLPYTARRRRSLQRIGFLSFRLGCHGQLMASANLSS